MAFEDFGDPPLARRGPGVGLRDERHHYGRPAAADLAPHQIELQRIEHVVNHHLRSSPGQQLVAGASLVGIAVRPAPVHVSHAILVFLLARAGILYFAASLLIPEPHDAEDGVLDLRVHMLRVRRRFFASLTLFPILDLVDTLLKGRARLDALGPYYPAYVVVFTGAMLCAALVRSERIPGIVVVIMLAILGSAVVGGAFGVIR